MGDQSRPHPPPRCRGGPEDDTAPPSLLDAVISHAARNPDTWAVRSTSVRWSYARLADVATRVRRLVEDRADPASRVALLMSGEPALVSALLGVEAANRGTLLLAPHADARTALRLVSNSGCPVVLTQHDQIPAYLPAIAERCAVTDGIAMWRIADAGASMHPPDPQHNAPALLHVTSGSYGAARVVARGRLPVMAELGALVLTLGLHEGDVVLCTSSVAHSYGCMGGLLAPLLAGASTVLCAPTQEALTLWRSCEPAIVFGTRALFAIARPGQKPMRLPVPRFLFSAGAPLPGDVRSAWEAHTAMSIRQDYGTTETGTIALDTAMPSRPHTVGRPLPHVEVRIAEPSSDMPLLPGEEGELQVRGPSVAGYYVEAGRLLSCLDGDGWYATGDTGRIHEGHVLVGRRLRRTMATRLGPLVPDELEAALAGLPGVRDAVILFPQRGAEGTTRVLVAADLSSHSAVRRHARRLLDLYVERYVLELHGSLPLSPAGKVLGRYG